MSGTTAAKMVGATLAPRGVEMHLAIATSPPRWLDGRSDRR